MSPSPTKPRARAKRAGGKTPMAPLPAVQNPAPSPITDKKAQPMSEADAFLLMLNQAARDPLVDVQKMRELLSMKKEIVTEQRIAAFNRDFALARQEMPRVNKDGAVEYPVDKTKPDGPKKEAFKFAKYETIDKAIRAIEIKYGFSRSFTTAPRGADGGGLIVTCRLLHREGHAQEAAIPVPLDTSGGKNNLQGYGSTFSYGKRYTTTMVWDIVTEGEDDDGNAAFADAFIDDAQFGAIQKLIEDNGIETAKFCGFLKIESLRAMTNKMYPRAIHEINARIAKIKQLEAAREGEKQ